MQDFWFYIQLGLQHVIDFSAYDHILFLAALAIPFTFKSWKKALVLVTVFTAAHCLSLALSTFGVVTFNVSLIEFLIPTTIFLTALFNLINVNLEIQHKSLEISLIATTFFGFIHGFGFSNYFKILLVEEEDKIALLLGFAIGIELSQLIIIISILFLALFIQSACMIKQSLYIGTISLVILVISIIMMVNTYPF